MEVFEEDWYQREGLSREEHNRRRIIVQSRGGLLWPQLSSEHQTDQNPTATKYQCKMMLITG